MALRGLVCGFAPGDFHRAGRTRRSLLAVGVAVEEEATLTVERLVERLRADCTPLLLARAGTWLAGHAELAAIPPSETGRALVGFGAVRLNPAWERYLAWCGGDLQKRTLWGRALPEPGIMYLEGAARAALTAGLTEGLGLREAAQCLVRDRRFRAVHLPALDACADAALRVLQVVTTIQIGGAERVTLDLAGELTRQGVRVVVAALGRATRLAFPQPQHFLDFSLVPGTPEARADAVARAARDFGADLVHAHLIRANDARAIKARGLPLAMTLHNMPAAWPVGLGAMGECADFIFACARAVEEAWREREESGDVAQPPVRTVWNGIDPKPYEPTAASHAAGRSWREARGWGAQDFVITAIANPRAQKRLHLLPEILQVLRVLLNGRPARLVFAGAHEEGSAEARQSVTEIEAAIARWGVAADGVHWTGGTGEVATVLAASDALVSASAFEGLSLAQLEALAAGVPVVATAVGGTGELANPLLHLLPVDASPEDFAAVLAGLAGVSPALRVPALPAHFTRYRMARRTRLLYPRVIERAQGGRLGEEVWLIANNFSTGGAQSSARRLLLGLAGRGVKVRVFTVQEEPDYPTPGRAALLAAGLPVTALPPPERCDAAEATARILEHAAVTPPRAVLFWNLITSYKILLADGFTETPIYDISPGEMYFTALARYFAEPRPGLPYLTPRDYGARLAGVVVKFAAEQEAAAVLGAPVHVIRNGIASGKSGEGLPRVSAVRGRGVFVIGTAARLSRDKRLGDLLDAFRLALPRLPRCELRIAGGVERGEEDHARELRRHARGLPVRWCGELPATAAFLAELDLFAMISEPAGCPNASLEAMAAGVPVVATDVGGAAEQVLDGVTGRLTPRRDAEALADALVELAHDGELRGRLAMAAAARVREEFSLERMIESYYGLCFGGEETRVPEVTAEAVVV